MLDVDEAVIDGEVIATDETGRPQSAPCATKRLLRGLRHPVARGCRSAIFTAQRARRRLAGHSAQGITDRLRGAIGRGAEGTKSSS